MPRLTAVPTDHVIISPGVGRKACLSVLVTASLSPFSHVHTAALNIGCSLS